MSLAEGVQARVAYKAYATGAITSNSEATSSVDPGASGAQALRRVSCSINLAKDTYQSNEIRSDRQIADFRHGTRRVSGSVSGEFSPATYWDLFEAACRGTAAAGVTAGPSDFTGCSADNATSKFIFVGGTPTTKGFRVGHIIRFTGLSDVDNNSKNFIILSFGGTSNREMTVYPAPDTMSADTSFTVAVVGQTLAVPSSSFVSRKFAFEVYDEDIDIARLFTECRIGGFTLNLPASGLATIEVPVMGRDMEVYEDSLRPLFHLTNRGNHNRHLRGGERPLAGQWDRARRRHRHHGADDAEPERRPGRRAKLRARDFPRQRQCHRANHGDV